MLLVLLAPLMINKQSEKVERVYLCISNGGQNRGERATQLVVNDNDKQD